MKLNNMNMADIMAFIEDDCYETEEKAEKIFDYITDLEAKLAESEKKREYLFSSNCDYVSQIEELKQQLAEKEEEIEYLKGTTVSIENFENAISELDQDKISFAVEQIEQLRHDIWTNQTDDGYTDMQVDLYDLNDTIDVRIMQLKEGK